MVDVVTSQIVFDGGREAVMKFTNVSDGTGETGVLKVDVSALAPSAYNNACDGVTIERIFASVNGMSVSIIWDATADVPCFILSPGMYTFKFDKLQLPNNAGAGVTGDILFSTIGATSGDTYTIVLQMVKSYATP